MLGFIRSMPQTAKLDMKSLTKKLVMLLACQMAIGPLTSRPWMLDSGSLLTRVQSRTHQNQKVGSPQGDHISELHRGFPAVPSGYSQGIREENGWPSRGEGRRIKPAHDILQETVQASHVDHYRKVAEGSPSRGRNRHGSFWRPLNQSGSDLLC